MLVDLIFFSDQELHIKLLHDSNEIVIFMKAITCSKDNPSIPRIYIRYL